MYSDSKLNPRRPRPSGVRTDGENKQVRNVYTRKVPYKVGYNWNRGGRLKELRIRHLARKFLKIWIQNTFGRILPHKAKSHCNSVILKRAFKGWRDEWWTSRREWSLTMRAECHHRYYLYNLVVRSWQSFLSLQREKRRKQQNAQLFADRQKMRLAWDRWEVFIEMRRMKNRMLESALEQNRLATLRSAWSLWQTRLQQCHDLYALNDQALKQHALTLQRKVWLHWKEMHTVAFCQKEKESRASLHFIITLKRKTLHQWISYVSTCQAKKKSEAVAQHTCYLRLLRTYWTRWNNALHHMWQEEERLQASRHLAKRYIQRRALDQWKVYVTLCREETERNQMASQHYHHHLLNAGLQGLSNNILWNKTHRLNNNLAVQQYHQNMLSRYWKLWQDRLEEAEDKSFQPLTQLAQKNYFTSLLSSCFNYWRKKLAEQRHMQQLEHHADTWFAERMLPRCFDSWVEFTLQRRLSKHRRHNAEVYNRQRQYTWVFYTWWGQSEQQKAQMLSERMAILHEERFHKQKAWSRWRQRTEQQMHEEEKEKASDRMYLHRLLHKTVKQWKDSSTEVQDRRKREQQACQQGDLRCMKWAVEKWKKFVQSQRVKRSKAVQMQHYYESNLCKHALVAWKSHHLQMSHIHAHAEELYKRQSQRFLRTALSEWRQNAALLAEIRLMEQQAQNHFQNILQHKVFLAWREGVRCAASRRRQQEETDSRAQKSLNQVRLLHSFRQWRTQAREAQRERMCMEKARLHHKSKTLSKALKAWNKHHYQCHKNKVMKRNGVMLLRLKIYQNYFEQWKIKLQHRRREAKQTERALWHWSLTLQAKVLYAWRLWVTDQRRKQEQAARAAQVYRDNLLKEGVTCILTYAAHMNDLTSTLTELSQEQRSRHLHRVVKRCAMRWKQRALCKLRETLEPHGKPPKKTVTFSVTTPGLKSISLSDSVGQEAVDEGLFKLIPPCKFRRQPRRRKEVSGPPQKGFTFQNIQKTSEITIAETALNPIAFSPPTQKKQPTVISSLPNSTSTHENTITSDFTSQTQDLLLPPSAFMTTGNPAMVGSSGHRDTQLVTSFKHHSSIYPEIHLNTSCGEIELPCAEEAVADPTSTLIKELMDIQMDMKSFQQDKKQLRAWQKLREVLQSWLQTSGKEEQMEKEDIWQELKQLEERIDRLSTKVTKQKPIMLLHVERIHHLQTVLQTSGVSLLLQQTTEMDTSHSASTT